MELFRGVMNWMSGAFGLGFRGMHLYGIGLWV